MSTFLPIIQQQQRGGAVVADIVEAQLASYLVEIDWNGTPVASAGFVGTYDDLVAERANGYGVKSVSIRRGRDDNMSEMQAGTATIVLKDPDGLYNPQNASSPLAANLLPLRPVRIRGNNGSVAPGSVTNQPLFRGYIRSIEHDPRRGIQETTIECVDRFAGFDRSVPDFALSGVLTTGIVIGQLVSLCDWEPPGLDTFASGDSIGSDWFPTGATVTEEIRKLLEAERGVVYVAADGTVVYEERADRTAKTSDATIADTMQALRPGVDLDRIANRAKVKTVSGEYQTANDLTSQAEYGIIDVGDIESPYVVDDAAAQDLADYLVEQLASPRSPMYGLELINRDATTMTQILQRDLQDRITVTDSLGGTSGDYLIEAIEHEITEGGKYHRCKWVLSARGTGAATGHTGAVGDVKKADPPTITIVPAGGSGPSDPKVGDLVYYEADSTNDIEWQFRWSGSEWRFIGGPPLWAEVTAAQTTTSTSFTATGFTALSLTAPLAGSYHYEQGADIFNNAGGFSLMSVSIGGGAAADADAVRMGGDTLSSCSRRRRKTGITAGQSFAARYRVTAGTGEWSNRWISLTPIAVTSI